MPTEVTQNNKKRQNDIVEKTAVSNSNNRESGVSITQTSANSNSQNVNSGSTQNSTLNNSNVSNSVESNVNNLNNAGSNQNVVGNNLNTNPIQNSANSTILQNSTISNNDVLGSATNNQTSTDSNLPNTTGPDMAEVLRRLNEIDAEYSSRYPVMSESIYNGLDYQSVEMPGQNAIRAEAENDLASYRENEISEITQDYNNDIASLDIRQNEIESDFNATQNQLENELNYGVAENQSQNISQGLGRSSIATNTERRFRASIDSELETALNKTNTELAEIALKRGIAESEFQSAIENFDISYANKLESRISELNKEYSKKQAEAIDYNERISKQREAAYNEWRAWADEQTSKLDAEKGRDKAYYVIEQLRGFSQNEAREFISDPNIVKSLGNWYAAVVDYIERVL